MAEIQQTQVVAASRRSITRRRSITPVSCKRGPSAVSRIQRYHMTAFRKHAFCLITLILCATPNLPAQVSTGTIAGTITDATGAIVANAPVVITDTQTGIVTQSPSSSAGFYSVPNLQTGTYTVSVNVPGFAPQEIKDVVLNVGA